MELTNIAYIYSLNCPTTGTIKYIGKTGNTKKRYNDHIKYTYLKSKKASWIKSLISKNLKPVMNILEIVDDKISDSREIFWIKYYEDRGFNLKNMSSGGTGGKTKSFGRPILRSDGKIFATVKDAANSINRTSIRIIQTIKARQKLSGYYWGYIGEGIIKPEVKEFKKIYCSNGKVYNGYKHVEECLNINTKSLSQCVKKGYSINGYKFSFSISFVQKKIQGKKIKLMSTGQIFNSSREASKLLNICYKQINAQLKNKQKTVKGMVFQYVEI